MAEVETTEPQGLDAILSSALDEHYVPDTPPEPTPLAAPQEAEGSDGRPRDERGRFASEAKPSEKDPLKPQTSAVAQPDPATKPIEPPRNFTAEDKAVFAKLQREHQEWVARVEGTREAEYTRRSQEAAELRRTAEPFLQAVAPFMPYLTQIAPQTGQAPAQMINGMLAVEYQLRTGSPQQKYQAFAQLAQTYGVDVGALATGQIPVQPQPPVQQFQQVLQPIQQQLAEIQRERKVQFDQSIASQIEAFANAKDDKGNTQWPYFEQLRSTMALSLANGEAKDLPEAYEKALVPWKAVLEAREVARRQADGNAQALEKAKRAASPRGSAGLPNGSASAKGLDAHLSAALERAGFQ